MNTKGFTTLELLIAVGVIGVVTTLASGAYYYHIPKAQSSEAVALAKSAQLQGLNNIKQAKCAVGDADRDRFIGKYGQTQIGGAFKVTTGSSCPSGCTIEYKFNASGVSADLEGKVLALDLLNDGRVSKNLEKTTLHEKYLPRDLVKIVTTDSCTVSAPTTAVKTEGSISGTEVGEADPTPPPEPAPPSPPTPTNPTPPTTPPTTPPSGVVVTPPVVVDNTGKPYGYAYRWNQSYNGGYMPMLEIGCVFQTNDPSVVRFAFPAYSHPAALDRIGGAVEMVTSASYKNMASRECMAFYNSIGSNFSSLPSIAVASIPSDRRFAAFIKF